MSDYLSVNGALPDSAGQILHWRKLHGLASSYAVAQLAQNRQPLVYVCSESAHLNSVAEELEFFVDKSLPVTLFPDWECLPYDRISPHPDLISQRLLALHKLPSMTEGIVILPVGALIQRLAPTNYIAAHTFDLHVDDEFDLQAFRQRLSSAGYYSVDQVMSPGEYAIRGGIVDVFPSGADNPFRLDLFDTVIESIRQFDAESQRSGDALQHVRLLPAREFPVDAQ
ncbi:MAG: hypothetical protein KJP04_00690, partial [Arenicella sp.]|nr:hypothetical protein [Arenicella sp.]